MGPHAVDSNTTKPAVSGGNLPQAGRRRGAVLEAGEIIVGGEFSGIQSVTLWTITSQSPLRSHWVEEDRLLRDWTLRRRSGSVEQLAAQLYKYYLCPRIYLQKNILWFSGDSYSAGGSCEKTSKARVFA